MCIFNKGKEKKLKLAFLKFLTVFLLFSFQSSCVFLMDLGQGPRDPWKANRKRKTVTKYDHPDPGMDSPQPADKIEPVVSVSKVGYSAGYRKRVAALIGINAYKKCSPLEGAISDVLNVKNVLTKAGFNQFLELYDREATRANILKLLGNKLPQFVGEEDLVLIYFAGHGQTETLPDGSKRGYIVPVDAEPTSIFSSAISMHQLRDLTNRILAKHVLYVMDSCYSGLGFVRGEK